MDKTKVVVLDMQPIDPPVGGGRIRLLGLYSRFNNNIDVTYVGTYDWRGPGYREHKLSECLTEVNVPLSEEHFSAHDKLSAELGSGCIDTSFPMLGHLSSNYIKRAKEEAKEAQIVIFSHPWIFPFVADTLDNNKQLIVYDSHNCEGMLRVKLIDNGSDIADKICREAVRCEVELCKSADLILACSEEDKQSYISLYGIDAEKIIIVPNGVFTNKIIPCNDKNKKDKLREKYGLVNPTACFIGSGYYPNEEAARLIIEVADLLPQYQFVIIGGVGNTLKDINVDMNSNIIITGFVDEQEKIEYLHASDIAINPMLSGSGTNIKMFDFMAAGLPIVTTDVGARGIKNTSDSVYLLCEKNKIDLKDKIIKLFDNNSLYNKLKEFGRKEACDKYSWEKISEALGYKVVEEYEKKNGLIPNILMVSTYPPEKCGIGKYAQQQVEYLRNSKSSVDVLAIRGEGKYRMQFGNPETILKLQEYKDRYNKIILQYHASFYYGDNSNFINTIQTHKAFKRLFKSNDNIEIICHEISYPLDRNNKGFRKIRDCIEHIYKKNKWDSASSIVFHTKKERDIFCNKLNIKLDEKKHRIVAPNHYYVKNRDISMEQARNELNIPLDEIIFLCIGFIQPHKSFDKVADVFSKIDPQSKKKFYIVGSLRIEYDITINYLNKLKNYAENYSNIELRDEFVSDELFDTWLIASDVIVIPYSEIWTSGVLGRAKLFDKVCIAREVGGLEEQLSEKDYIFKNDEDLYDIIEKLHFR